MKVRQPKGESMKGRFKTVLASVFAFALALTAAVPAFATSVPTGTADQALTTKPTITVTTANPDDNLEAYKVLKASVGSDNVLKYEFTDLYNSFKSSSQYTSAGVDADTPEKYAALGEDDLKKLLGAFTAYIKAQNPVPAGDYSATTDGSGKATFDSVEMGQYIIVGKGGTGSKIYQTVTAEVIPVVVNGEYKLFKDYPTEMKTTEPTPEKKITGGTTLDGDLNTATVGDTVKYQLSATVPEYPVNATNTTFYMRDELSEGLTLKSTADDIVVKGINAAGQETTLTLGTDYTVTIDGQKLYIDYKYDQIKGYASVTADYEAVLNEHAKTGATTGNPNTYDLIWSNNPYNGGTSENHPEGPGYGKGEKKQIVYTYALKIHKYEKGNESENLAGATFEIKDTAGNVVATVTTDSNGFAAVSGLEKGTYTLHETAAPAGYKLMTQDQTVTIDQSNATETVTTETTVEYTTDVDQASIKVQATDANGVKLWLTSGAQGETPEASATQPAGKVPAYVKSVTTTVVTSGTTGTAAEGFYTVGVENEKGGNLPTTGGMGTTILYIIGGVLVIGSAVFMVTKKRMANNEQ